MRNIQGKVPQSAFSRFLLGAGIGVAISIPLFQGVEDVPVRILFMLAFAGIMGGAQVIAGGTSARSKSLTRWLLAIGTLTFGIGVAVFFMVN